LLPQAVAGPLETTSDPSRYTLRPHLPLINSCVLYAAGLTPYDSESGGVTPIESFNADTAPVSREKRAHLKPVSFDDYYALWKGIATSIHGYKKPNHCKYEWSEPIVHPSSNCI
jgi:hypothetical protein